MGFSCDHSVLEFLSVVLMNFLCSCFQLLAKTVSGVFHSLKTALPSFESSDNQGGGSEGAGSTSGGLGTGSGGDLMLRGRSGGGILIERNKLAAFLSSGTKGEYELKLDITAEEEVITINSSVTYRLPLQSEPLFMIQVLYQ